jgi:hypothetical protein
MRPTSIHTAAWRYLGAHPDASFKLPHLKRFIRTLEREKFDPFFMVPGQSDFAAMRMATGIGDRPTTDHKRRGRRLAKSPRPSV